MTLFYYDPIFQEHVTGDHPENGGRTLSVIRHLNFIALDTSCRRPAWEPASVERLCYVHTREYVDSVERFALKGGGYLDEDTVVSTKSYEVARQAAGAVCDAVQRVVAGEDKTAFCLVRPPGHHAMPDHAMGFCLFNNIAVGARVARRELGIERVLIVDFDVHHGNGTQAMFWEDASVGYFSMHRSPLYPGTGAAEEIGAGDGIGTTLNLPVAVGTPRDDQMRVFEREVQGFAHKIKPQLVLVSAGFDSHKDDPVGSLGLENEDFRGMTRCLLDVAAEHANGRLVSVLEGGYNPHALTDCVAIHLEELLDAP
ncbi:histone deacetylase family protein [Aureliella helgolandensis]|uniref:Histone deacetylase-like amidohydrolase n=1 Tax=Aureliella helgolandensis TaxID=2527968 RepID=A0A518G4W4_9BACT|nr:histone deacetylase [Aureliella helgolandensis]QDV23634.1 Histone deacetylase-like amidohydrolase [Aureliella helgolandensis]